MVQWQVSLRHTTKVTERWFASLLSFDVWVSHSSLVAVSLLGAVDLQPLLFTEPARETSQPDQTTYTTDILLLTSIIAQATAPAASFTQLFQDKPHLRSHHALR
jgi:hypothetical protein